MKRTSTFAPTSLTFASRTEYLKLHFKDNPNVDTKLRWLTEVNRASHLDRTQAEVKMAAITSQFVYISRRRMNFVNNVPKGEFLCLLFEVRDSPERPRKFPTYLLTRFPVNMDPSLAKELSGVYTEGRFYQNGKPLSRVVITWSLSSPLRQQSTSASFPTFQHASFAEWRISNPPSRYRCWGIGHISRYCSGIERCA